MIQTQNQKSKMNQILEPISEALTSLGEKPYNDADQYGWIDHAKRDEVIDRKLLAGDLAAIASGTATPFQEERAKRLGARLKTTIQVGWMQKGGLHQVIRIGENYHLMRGNTLSESPLPYTPDNWVEETQAPWQLIQCARMNNPWLPLKEERLTALEDAITWHNDRRTGPKPEEVFVLLFWGENGVIFHPVEGPMSPRWGARVACSMAFSALDTITAEDLLSGVEKSEGLAEKIAKFEVLEPR